MPKTKPTTVLCHVVAVPYPGRGHINPMMNLCKLLLSKTSDILITFVVTEEWLGFLCSDSTTSKLPDNIQFATLPNVIPSELDRAKDFPGFIRSVYSELPGPFEQLLDRLEPAPTAIVADTFLKMVVGAGKRRNIPVASFWTQSALMFSVLHHFELLELNGQFPVDLSERGHELVDYIPGISPTCLADLPTIFHGDGRAVLPAVLQVFAEMLDAQYLLFSSFYELESPTIDSLEASLPLTIYTVGPTIPYFALDLNINSTAEKYLWWLDSQPPHSVLYVSLGSFLSVSSAQLDEIIAGIRDSGVRFLWVARGDAHRIQDACGTDSGLVVSWCDQMKVVCHGSVGGFWTHCGWNSTLEAIFAGVPMLTCPIFWDQVPNSKEIVEDWKVGVTVKKKGKGDIVVSRREIAALVKRLMDPGSEDGREMRRRSRELREQCRRATAKGGSSDKSLDAFINKILKDASETRAVSE